MKSVLAIAALVASAAAQLQSSSNGSFTCPQPNQNYCISASGTSNIIVRCDASGVGQPGNCNDNLAGSCGGVCDFAPCRQSSDTAGDAQCSLVGAYDAQGKPIGAAPSVGTSLPSPTGGAPYGTGNSTGGASPTGGVGGGVGGGNGGGYTAATQTPTAVNTAAPSHYTGAAVRIGASTVMGGLGAAALGLLML